MQNMQAAGQSSERPRPRELEGLAAWVLARFRALRGVHSSEHKQMRVLETLSLGAKRQLMLVECGSDRYLVGCGGESIQTIVRASGQIATCEFAEGR
jgi:flagellar biosynthetic protein FliO